MRKYEKNTTYTTLARKYPLLKREEEITLGKLVQKGNKEAMDKLVISNLRLVMELAHGFTELGLPYYDLVQEGNIGLMEAAKRFDPTKGAKFSTYACWQIKQQMKLGLCNQSRTIRIPISAYGKITKIHAEYIRLKNELGREPTHQEVSKDTRYSPKQAGESLINEKLLKTASLDAPITEEDIDCLEEVIKDEKTIDTDQNPDKERQNIVTELYQIINEKLDSRQKIIITLKYGLNGNKPKILEDIAKVIGKTRERIRQIKKESEKVIKKELEKKGYSNFDLRLFNN